MHAINCYIVNETHCVEGGPHDLKYLEETWIGSLEGVSHGKIKKSVQSNSIQKKELVPISDVKSLDLEMMSFLCHKKPSQNSDLLTINYRSSKAHRHPFRNSIATALGVTTDMAIISLNKVAMSTTVPGTCFISMQSAPYVSLSSAASSVSTLVERSLEFSVFSSHAWYQYLILMISLAVVKLSIAMRTMIPVIFRKTTKTLRMDTLPQGPLATSKITPTIQKRIIFSQPSTRCKIRARFIPFVHSSVGLSSHTKFRLLPSLRATSFCTLLSLIFLETVLLSTVSNCAKTFYMHWNTSNSIFRIDNTDHIIDVNKGNLAFEFDQVHIICPVYEPGTFENETEKYIIYNVSKVEYETCRITNADPRVIAICDKPQKLMFFTITFRPFTPQPGGLEFLPGNDYYFISTSSKDDLYRRIGGRCSTNNMKVVFKVCCAVDGNNKTNTGGAGSITSGGNNGVGGVSVGISNGSPDGMTAGIDISANSDVSNSHANLNQHMNNNANTIGINGVTNGLLPIGSVNIGSSSDTSNADIQTKSINSPSGTSINTNIDQFNRIPMQTGGIHVMGNNVANVGSIGLGGHGSGVTLTSGGHGGISMISAGGGTFSIGQYPTHPGHTGIRVNNAASQHHTTHKNIDNNDDHYDKHPNEVVKNEELTYNSGALQLQPWTVLKIIGIATSWPIINIFGRLLGQSFVSTNNRYTDNEEKLITPYTTQASSYLKEKRKRRDKTNLTLNFNKLMMCFIVVFALTIFVIRISLNSKKSQKDNTASTPTTMTSLSIENAAVPHSLVETFHSYLKKKSVFIEFKSFFQPGPRRLTSLVAKEMVSANVCRNTPLSKKIQAKMNNSEINYFLSSSVNITLIKYCHTQVSSVSVKVKRFR